jgi:hypothetical protein
MFIIEQIKGLLGWLLKLLVINLVLIFWTLAAPAILFVLPQVRILQHRDVGGLALAFFWATPFAVGLWMAGLCHWHSVQLWHREGHERVLWGSEWRKAHGGYLHTASKSTGFMVLGFFGSYASEIAFFLVSHGHVTSTARAQVWFALFPFAAFAPVILLLLKRRNYTEGREDDLKATADKTVDMSNDEYKAFLKKELADRTADGKISMGDWLELRKANGF